MTLALRRRSAEHLGLSRLRRLGWTRDEFRIAVAELDALAGAHMPADEGQRPRLAAELLLWLQAESASPPGVRPSLDLWRGAASPSPERFASIVQALTGPEQDRAARVTAATASPVEALIEFVEDWLPPGGEVDLTVRDFPEPCRSAILVLGELGTPEAIAAVLSWLGEWDHLNGFDEPEANPLRASLHRAARHLVAPACVLWPKLGAYQRRIVVEALVDQHVRSDEIVALCVTWLRDAGEDHHEAFCALMSLGRCLDPSTLPSIRAHLDRCLDAGNLRMATDAAEVITEDFCLALDDSQARRLTALRHDDPASRARARAPEA